MGCHAMSHPSSLLHSSLQCGIAPFLELLGIDGESPRYKGNALTETTLPRPRLPCKALAAYTNPSDAWQSVDATCLHKGLREV